MSLSSDLARALRVPEGVARLKRVRRRWWLVAAVAVAALLLLALRTSRPDVGTPIECVVLSGLAEGDRVSLF